MMKRTLWLSLSLFSLLFVAACGASDDNESLTADDLPMLEVDFEVPETASVGDTVELQATVTYGEEIVEDADEVLFEVWLEDHEDESENFEGVHQGDGVYTAEVTFDEEGTYEMYAHTTARDLHTMPLKSIEVE
jgi:plastocyanin